MEKDKQQINQESNLNQNPSPTNPAPNQRGNFLLIIGVVILMLVIGAGAYSLGRSSAVKQPEQLPTPTPIPIPVENALYFGTYNGDEAIFFTNSEKQKSVESREVKKIDPYTGLLQKAGGETIYPFDFRDLVNPKKIFTGQAGTISNSILEISSFLNPLNESTLFVSIIHSARDHPTCPVALTGIYSINLNSLESRELWRYGQGVNKVYENYQGGVKITGGYGINDDKYLTLSIDECYKLNSGLPEAKVYLNSGTANEKYLGAVGEVTHNPDKTISYQKLAPVKEACEPATQGCNNGVKTDYKPSGPVITDNLP